jgi:hypothetical protein
MKHAYIIHLFFKERGGGGRGEKGRGVGEWRNGAEGTGHLNSSPGGAIFLLGE